MNSLSSSTISEYPAWQRQFMWHRLQLGVIIAFMALLTFIGLNLSRYPEFKASWLYTNLSQEAILLPCLVFLQTRFGKQYPEIIFLLLSWSITIIPQYWALQYGIIKFDFVTWTLVFLVQATLIPVKWWLHLLSQIGVFVCFFAIQFWSHAILESQIARADPLFLYLYLFWFSVICDISVYLYEHLQRNEFQAKEKLKSEKEKSERLLLNILPEKIAKRLKQQPVTVADNFSQVSVLFADIVGFTEMSSRLPPPQLVELLNDVFSTFDKLVDHHGLEKIKTIGDAYMVVAGLPELNPRHLTQIADLALEMQQAVAQFDHQCECHLSIRIGIHTGPVVAGVIGISKFAYDLWGDTVNIASRMESHGKIDHIQVSEDVYQQLKQDYLFEARGFIPIKGKGEMMTYFLKQKLT
ncbi:MAG: adenylate/guanylate cyclase domain-containing protein [Pseudomonadota bacterium]|nr:adenylate/guanylate cyclase domain-containing protein [Pseudomonadota bacterium]